MDAEIGFEQTSMLRHDMITGARRGCITCTTCLERPASDGGSTGTA